MVCVAGTWLRPFQVGEGPAKDISQEAALLGVVCSSWAAGLEYADVPYYPHCAKRRVSCVLPIQSCSPKARHLGYTGFGVAFSGRYLQSLPVNCKPSRVLRD